MATFSSLRLVLDDRWVLEDGANQSQTPCRKAERNEAKQREVERISMLEAGIFPCRSAGELDRTGVHVHHSVMSGKKGDGKDGNDENRNGAMGSITVKGPVRSGQHDNGVAAE